MQRKTTSLVKVSLLGPVAVEVDGAVHHFASERQAMALTILALRPGRWVSMRELVDRLWNGQPPRTAEAALRVHIAKLRDALGSVSAALPSGQRGYALDRKLVHTDLDDLAGLAASLGVGPEQDLATITQALALWRGDPFEQFAEDPELRAEAVRISDQRLSLEDARIDRLLDLGRPDDACSELSQLVSAQPFREKRIRQLMVAQYRCGRQADALATFASLTARLSATFGLDPASETRDLELRILRQDPELRLPAADRGSAAVPDGGRPTWLAEPPRASDVLLGVVAGRLKAIGPDAARLVGFVALLDESATPRVLAQAMELRTAELSEPLRRAEAAGLVTASVGPLPDDEPVRLQHPGIGAAIVALVSPEEHAASHRHCARALAGLGVPAMLVQAAWHAVAGGSASEIGVSVLRATDAAVEGGALRTADELSAAALATDCTDAVRADLLTRRVRVLALQGRWAESLECWGAAIDAARSSGDAERLALAVLAREDRMRSFHIALPDTATLLREALDAVGPVRSALRVRLESALLMDTMLAAHSADEARHLLQQAAASAETVGDPMALAAVERARCTMLRGTPDVAARRDAARDLAAAALKTGDPYWRAVSVLSDIFDDVVEGQLGRVRAQLERLGDIAGHSGSARVLWHHALTECTAAREAGDFAAANRWAERALLRGAESGIPDAPAAAALHHFLVTFLCGSVVPMLESLRAHALQGGEHALALGIVAYAEAQAGNLDRARQLIVRGIERLDIDHLETTPPALGILGEAAAEAGASDLGVEIERRLRPYAGQFLVFGQVTATFGPVDRCLGRLALLQGDAAGALALFEAAERASEAAGAPPWAVLSTVGRVSALRELGRPDEAARVARARLTVASELGLSRFAQQLREAL